MPLLQVRNIPTDLYENLSRVAQKENRSIAQETIVLLRSALDQKEERTVKRKKIIEEIEEMNIDSGNNFPDPVLLIREDRDR